MNGYLKGGLITLFILSFLGISGWCLHQVSGFPYVYATKSEVKEIKGDIKDSLRDMKSTFTHRQDKLDGKIDNLTKYIININPQRMRADTSDKE